LSQIDQQFKSIDSNNEFKTVDTFYEKAYDLMKSAVAKKAFDIEAEPETIRNRYGRTPVGQGCLLARRLVENGVRFVTVSKGWLNWDTHGRNFTTLEKLLLPELDMAYSALLEDLHQRGLLESTLVVLMGEFGRTPEVNSDAGRDHWSKAFTVVVAGGGVKGGQALGATDAKAAEVTKDPYQVEDLFTSPDIGASRVRDLMVASNVPADRIRAEGRADGEPVQPNDTEAHRALNRRVEITVLTSRPEASARPAQPAAPAASR